MASQSGFSIKEEKLKPNDSQTSVSIEKSKGSDKGLNIVEAGDSSSNNCQTTGAMEMNKDPLEAQFAFISHSQQSYPSSEPQIDNMQLARRKRRRTSPTELTILEDEFKACYKPSKTVRQRIADKVGMTEKAVQIWFQNKRQSMRRRIDSDGAISIDSTSAFKSNKSVAIYSDDDFASEGSLTDDDAKRDIKRGRPSLKELSNSSSSRMTLIPPSRTSSANAIRLSMSFDGKAEVIQQETSLSGPTTFSSSSSTRPSLKQLSSAKSFPAFKTLSDTRTPLSAASPSALNSKTNSSTTSKFRSIPISGLLHDSEPLKHSQNKFLSSSKNCFVKNENIYPDPGEFECISNLLALRKGAWN